MGKLQRSHCTVSMGNPDAVLEKRQEILNHYENQLHNIVYLLPPRGMSSCAASYLLFSALRFWM